MGSPQWDWGKAAQDEDGEKYSVLLHGFRQAPCLFDQ